MSETGDARAAGPVPPGLTAERAQEILATVAGARVIVLGDMVVDEHIIGRAAAVAREAPVPVIEQVARLVVPGGATNVAANLRAMGCAVMVAGVVGPDSMADVLRDQLEARGIHTAGMMHDPARSTSVKLRIWAGGDRQRPQSMVGRVDSVDRRELDVAVAEQLVIYLEGAVPEARGLVISDYENGVVSEPVLDAALPLARRHNVTVTVDAHGGLSRFEGASLVTPNQPEAEAELGRALTTVDDARRGADDLRERLAARTVLLTLGDQGMVMATEGAEPAWIPVAKTTLVADPTGAGDTVAAAMTAGLLGAATDWEAAQLADLAARVVVRRLGAAVASVDDIVAEARRETA